MFTENRKIKPVLFPMQVYDKRKIIVRKQQSSS